MISTNPKITLLQFFNPHHPMELTSKEISLSYYMKQIKLHLHNSECLNKKRGYVRHTVTVRSKVGSQAIGYHILNYN